MNLTILFTTVEYEMPKDLQRKDKRYKRGLKGKVKNAISRDCNNVGLGLAEDTCFLIFFSVVIDVRTFVNPSSY